MRELLLQECKFGLITLRELESQLTTNNLQRLTGADCERILPQHSFVLKDCGGEV